MTQATARSVWRSRALVVLAVVVFFEAALAVAGMGPHYLLLGAIIAVGAVIAFVAVDLGDSVMPAMWPSAVQPSQPSDGADWRVGTLRMLLLNERRSEGANSRLHTLLVGLIDDHLRDEHRIDRAADPEAAAAIIGPELTSFVDAQVDWRLLQSREVARIVTLIENL